MRGVGMPSPNYILDRKWALLQTQTLTTEIVMPKIPLVPQVTDDAESDQFQSSSAENIDFDDDRALIATYDGPLTSDIKLPGVNLIEQYDDTWDVFSNSFADDVADESYEVP